MSGVECRGLPTLTMAVDELGTMVIARDAILRAVAPLRARFDGEPKMDARLKKMDSWIPGFLGFGSHCVLEPTAQDWPGCSLEGGARWVMDPQMN